VRRAAEIRDRVKELIEAWIGVGGNVYEEQYMGAYFALCREVQKAGYHEASHSPRLSADALYDAVSSQWSAHEDQNRLAGSSN
jgi:hypothetical protein